MKSKLKKTGQVNVRWSGERQVNVKSQSELDIGGRETCFFKFVPLAAMYFGVTFFKRP